MAQEKQKTTDAEVDEMKVEESTALTAVERLDKAGKLVNKSMMWSAGLGLIPIPLANWAGLTATQLIMLEKIAGMYGLNFKKDLVKKLVGVLIAGSAPYAPAALLAFAARRIPVVGIPLTVITLPVIAAASTYALGKVFVQHFESGGTFLTFDPEKVKAYYAEEFQNGAILAKEATS